MQVERRKRIRILTLKNFGYAAVVLLLVLAAANVISEMRGPKRGEYGRLLQREEPAPVVVKHPEVVQEGEVPDLTPSGPPAAVLSGLTENSGVAPAILPANTVEPAAGRIAVATQSKGVHGVTIVGGADGIRVEHAATDTAPKLSGGIFRQ